MKETGAGGSGCAWVVAAEMGLGHLRAAYPLRDMAKDGIIVAGARDVTSAAEHRLWNRVRRGFNYASRSRRVPLAGPLLYRLLERIEHIEALYPGRDLSAPTPQARLVKYLIARRGMGNALIERMSRDPLPLVTTFYIPALAADYLGYEGAIYCVVCDTDINRVWVAERPRESRIIYLAPCETAVRRLRLYGVPESRIRLTGFPLPTEILGGRDRDDVPIEDLLQRLANLDPGGGVRARLRPVMEAAYGGTVQWPVPGPSRVMFSIGGAAAHTGLARKLLRGLRDEVLAGAVKLTIGAGVRPAVAGRLREDAQALGLGPALGLNLCVLDDREPDRYFARFNDAVRRTDVLWTKPSELTFYAELGIPLIVATPVGPHEERNRRWLLARQAGIDQEHPAGAGEWLRDLLRNGTLAELAWNGYVHGLRSGAATIQSLVGG